MWKFFSGMVDHIICPQVDLIISPICVVQKTSLKPTEPNRV